MIVKLPEFSDIDCSSFTQVRRIEEMKPADVADGLRHELEVLGPDDHEAYAGPAPHLIQHSVLNFLRRQRSLYEARKRGYRWR